MRCNLCWDYSASRIGTDFTRGSRVTNTGVSINRDPRTWAKIPTDVHFLSSLNAFQQVMTEHAEFIERMFASPTRVTSRTGSLMSVIVSVLATRSKLIRLDHSRASGVQAAIYTSVLHQHHISKDDPEYRDNGLARLVYNFSQCSTTSLKSPGTAKIRNRHIWKFSAVEFWRQLWGTNQWSVWHRP